MSKRDHQLLQPSPESHQELKGKLISYAAMTIITCLVATIFLFITAKGLALFVDDGISIKHFFLSTRWHLSEHIFGALPMVVTSLLITLLAGIIALPLALVVAIAITEMLPHKVNHFLQPIIELLVGLPSVVYGYLGLTIIVPALRKFFGGTGFGLLAGVCVLFLMILPTITSMSIETLRAVPKNYRLASAGLGATRWQTIQRVILPSARGGILTAMVFGMARAFGEALAVQMVIGNAAVLPKNLMSSGATLTSVLTTSIGNTVMGTTANNALWSLALILLIMSLVFNLLIRLIARKGVK